jgi:hypothetical protein
MQRNVEMVGAEKHKHRAQNPLKTFGPCWLMHYAKGWEAKNEAELFFFFKERKKDFGKVMGVFIRIIGPVSRSYLGSDCVF